jgi:hypothetical protein
MATTTNFGWETPDDTDLVKDGALAMRTLGNAIDTSLVDLKGGTTGQVLSKTSNTDMDFTWVTSDDANAIQNAIVDAKGDLITATAADTPSRLAVGTNGQVLTADSSAATGLAWASPASGGMTLLNSGNTSMSGATFSITSISGSYNLLDIFIVGVKPANDANSLRIRFNGDSTANRHFSADASNKVFGETNAFNATSGAITYGMDNGTDNGLIRVTIPNYANTSTWKFAQCASIVNDSSTTTSAIIYSSNLAVYNQTGAITSLDFFFNSGNITSGTMYVYGVK